MWSKKTIEALELIDGVDVERSTESGDITFKGDEGCEASLTLKRVFPE